jgi:hypothetical protein
MKKDEVQKFIKPLRLRGKSGKYSLMKSDEAH